ncbi:hypothetical protein [Candidatus Spongiihabitans sp.]|uniref:hypothetical protein n=1 Tax=Candidatus Spongiihabitans sp. TaxID=3101308 RepID=UPI003C705798
MTKTHHISDREKKFAAMLEDALSRPGVREVMQVYQWWQKQDQALDSYRSATKEIPHILTSDRANIS